MVAVMAADVKLRSGQMGDDWYVRFFHIEHLAFVGAGGFDPVCRKLLWAVATCEALGTKLYGATYLERAPGWGGCSLIAAARATYFLEESLGFLKISRKAGPRRLPWATIKNNRDCTIKVCWHKVLSAEKRPGFDGHLKKLRDYLKKCNLSEA
jgi:hypothetical protein